MLLRLSEAGIVRSRVVSGELSFQLTFAGVNVLSAIALIRRGVVAGVGDRIGVGKESEVYIAWTPSGAPVSLKFHEEGARSFRSMARRRAYGRRDRRAPWLDVAIESAERELRALVMVNSLGGAVPKPLTSELNCVVTEYIEGVELTSVKGLSEEQATKVLNDVVDTIRIAFKEAGIVHGDLSPYNVLVSAGETLRGYIIDWPQYVSTSDPAAMSLLANDVKRIAAYFNKNFGLTVNVEDLLRRITGSS